MDADHTWEDQKFVLSDFIQKMTDSGYDHLTRSEVIKSAAKKFYCQLMEQESGGRRLYRSAEDMAVARRLKDLTNKTWFRSKRGGAGLTPSKDLPWRTQVMEQQARKEERKRTKQESPENVKTEGERYSAGVKLVETVVFVPTTPNSSLRKLLQKADDQLCLSVNSPSVRFVERGGSNLDGNYGQE